MKNPRGVQKKNLRHRPVFKKSKRKINIPTKKELITTMLGGPNNKVRILAMTDRICP